MLELLSEYGNALIGLAGVIIGGFIVAVRDGMAVRAERKRDGSYSAIRLICILDEYAHKCSDVAGDDGYAEGRPARRTEGGEDYCEAQVIAPEPLDYPNDISWRSLDETLMHRILALPNKARSTNRYVSASAENAFPPEFEEFFEPRQEGYAKLGLEALLLIDDLRQRHGVSARSRTDLGEGWDLKEYLQMRLDQFAKRDADRRARRDAMPSPFSLSDETDTEAPTQ
ncbi:hypothetical protein [Algirhabdus cladophorae]|uniref:hypothetical protein n=1 Tax=Algirhabdus cladophorae TaxID=3377108 RepID=UPI003B848356